MVLPCPNGFTIPQWLYHAPTVLPCPNDLTMPQWFYHVLTVLPCPNSFTMPQWYTMSRWFNHLWCITTDCDSVDVSRLWSVSGLVSVPQMSRLWGQLLTGSLPTLTQWKVVLSYTKPSDNWWEHLLPLHGFISKLEFHQILYLILYVYKINLRM